MLEKLKKTDILTIKDAILAQRGRQELVFPQNLSRTFECDVIRIDGYPCYRYVPKQGFEGRYIFYLYSSFLSFDMDSEELAFVLGICERTGMGAFIPMYPLTPENDCRETFRVLTKEYKHFSIGQDIEKLILMGSASGAGLALSLSLLSWKEGMRKPDQLILLSPSIDTEFFDAQLELRMLETSDSNGYFYSELLKDYINAYWVKDYAAKTEYTSPFYEDYTDICDDVVLFSGTDSVLNCYARAFYTKAKMQGVNIRFFEFEEQGHNFIIDNKNEDAAKAKELLCDVLLGRYESRYALYEIYPIKLAADMSRREPEYFKDSWAERFIYDNKFDFSGITTEISEFDNLRLAANQEACDTIVKQFITEFPNGTIVNLGCRLGNAFDRLDNGRILWYNVDSHNIMSIRRSMYGERPREKTIGRSLMDFSWIDDIVCDRKCGVMFFCNDMLTYMHRYQVRELFEKLWEKFPGTQMVFTASAGVQTFLDNIRKSPSVMKRRRRCMSVDDAQKLFNDWRIDYRVMSEEPVTEYLPKFPNLKAITKVKLKLNHISYGYKVIRVKLGSESYGI